MGRPCLVGLGGAKALSGCWESSAPLLILARWRAGPRGCRYGGEPGAESVAWDPGRGRARWASPRAQQTSLLARKQALVLHLTLSVGRGYGSTRWWK